MSYPQTRAALKSYDAEPTGGHADLVLVAYWLEASTDRRARMPNPTVDQVRAMLVIETPAGLIALVSVDVAKMNRGDIIRQLQRQADHYGKTITLVEYRAVGEVIALYPRPQG